MTTVAPDAESLEATVARHLADERVFTEDRAAVARVAEQVRAEIDECRQIARVVTDYPRGEDFRRLKLYRRYLSRATAALTVTPLDRKLRER